MCDLNVGWAERSWRGITPAGRVRQEGIAGRAVGPSKEPEGIAEAAHASSCPAGSQRFVGLSLEGFFFIKGMNSIVREMLLP